jgi:hypothetical protein
VIKRWQLRPLITKENFSMAAKRKSDTAKTAEERDRNPDPITDAPGSHPVGTGVGTAVGGVLGAAAGAAATGAATGAAAGSVAGPVGVAAGTVIGGVAGGLAGKAIAEQIDPTAEEAYWREEYPNRDYYSEDVTYEDIGPAYRYGWESRAQYPERQWQDVEPELQRNWEEYRSGESSIDWQRAQAASRDAWERIDARARRRPR